MYSRLGPEGSRHHLPLDKILLVPWCTLGNDFQKGEGEWADSRGLDF